MCLWQRGAQALQQRLGTHHGSHSSLLTTSLNRQLVTKEPALNQGNNFFLNQNFSVSVGASPIDEVDEGKGEGWKEHLTWEVRCDSL